MDRQTGRAEPGPGRLPFSHERLRRVPALLPGEAPLRKLETARCRGRGDYPERADVGSEALALLGEARLTGVCGVVGEVFTPARG